MCPSSSQKTSKVDGSPYLIQEKGLTANLFTPESRYESFRITRIPISPDTSRRDPRIRILTKHRY